MAAPAIPFLPRFVDPPLTPAEVKDWHDIEKEITAQVNKEVGLQFYDERIKAFRRIANMKTRNSWSWRMGNGLFLDGAHLVWSPLELSARAAGLCPRENGEWSDHMLRMLCLAMDGVVHKRYALEPTPVPLAINSPHFPYLLSRVPSSLLDKLIATPVKQIERAPGAVRIFHASSPVEERHKRIVNKYRATRAVHDLCTTFALSRLFDHLTRWCFKDAVKLVQQYTDLPLNKPIRVHARLPTQRPVVPKKTKRRREQKEKSRKKKKRIE